MFFRRSSISKAGQHSPESALILPIEQLLQLLDPGLGQSDAIDNATEETDAAKVDLEIGNAQFLQGLHADQQHFDVRAR